MWLLNAASASCHQPKLEVKGESHNALKGDLMNYNCQFFNGKSPGLVEPSLTLVGLAKFTRTVRPNNSESFWSEIRWVKQGYSCKPRWRILMRRTQMERTYHVVNCSSSILQYRKHKRVMSSPCFHIQNITRNSLNTHVFKIQISAQNT